MGLPFVLEASNRYSTKTENMYIMKKMQENREAKDMGARVKN